MLLGGLIKFLEFIASLDVDKLLFNIYKKPETQELIITLNTKSQLFEKSIDSRGVELRDIGGGYSAFTEELNKGKQFQYKGASREKKVGESPFLFEDGIFYGSWIVTPTSDGFFIDANPIRDDTNLFQDWGEDIVGLTEESKEILKAILIEDVRKTLLLEIEKKAANV